MGILQHKPRTFGGHAWQVAVRSVVQVRKASCIRNPSADPIYSITNSKTRLKMVLLAMRITNVPVIANLHDNSGVGTFLLRIYLFLHGGGPCQHIPLYGVLNCYILNCYMICNARMAKVKGRALRVLHDRFGTDSQPVWPSENLSREAA
ncbi:unnamed protein product [Amoebophrya sp. A120]|nr:unnamed protein product [Amoebophrya sp. A120]|eukprot:GSA120T00009530001.1